MIIFMPSLSGLKEVIEGARVNPIDIGDALRKANESYSGLMNLLSHYKDQVEEINLQILRSGGAVTPN